MADVQKIASTTNARIKALVKLRRAGARREAGVLIAEGMREVERALGAGLEPTAWYVCPGVLGWDVESIVESLPGLRQAAGFELGEAALAKASYREHPEGLIATFRLPMWEPATLLADASASAVWVVAAGWEKPGNLGALARSAEAMGVEGIIVAGGRCDPWNPNAIRASTGAVFSLPILDMTDDDARTTLGEHGLRIIAATDEAPTPCDAADLSGKVAIVIGTEDAGLERVWREAADLAVSIPMVGRLTDSLNASVSGGIMLYECLRQRRREAGA